MEPRVMDSIREGFTLTHRNWQLILVLITVSVINLALLLFFLGIPVIVSIVYLGFDLASAQELIPFFAQNPVKFFGRYLGILLLVGMAVTGYLICSSLLFLYSLGGTLGVLDSAALDPGRRFSLSLFFREAGGHFKSLFWLVSILTAGFFLLILVFMFLGGIGGSILKSIESGGNPLPVFLRSFAAVIFSVTGAVSLLAFSAFGALSVTVSVAEGAGALDSLSRTYSFLVLRPGAIFFSALLLFAMAAAHVIVLPFTLLPVIVPLVNTLLRTYLSVVLWGSLIAYYMNKNGGDPVDLTEKHSVLPS